MAVGVDIGAIVASIGAIDVTAIDDDRLADLVIEAEKLLNAAHGLSAAALEEFQRRGSWAADGALSATGWVAARTGASTRVLRARVRVGAGLRLLKEAAAPARAGLLNPQNLAALAACARRHPELAARDEALLVDQALRLDADSFGVVARQWAERAAAVDAPDPTTIETPEPVDEVHLSETLDGRFELRGNFSAETGQLVHAALDAEVDRTLRARRDGDPSVPRSLRTCERPRWSICSPRPCAVNRPSSRCPTATGWPWSSAPMSPKTCRSPAATRPLSGSCSMLKVRSWTWVG